MPTKSLIGQLVSHGFMSWEIQQFLFYTADHPTDITKTDSFKSMLKARKSFVTSLQRAGKPLNEIVSVIALYYDVPAIKPQNTKSVMDFLKIDCFMEDKEVW